MVLWPGRRIAQHATLACEPNQTRTQKLKYLTLTFCVTLPSQGEHLRNPRTKPCNGNVKYYKIGSLSGSVRMPMLRNHVACCAIRLPGHNTTLPPKSARSYSQAPPGEGLTPHTIHHYSFGLLQAITVVSHSDPDS